MKSYGIHPKRCSWTILLFFALLGYGLDVVTSKKADSTSVQQLPTTVVLVKVGGSSITEKGQLETLNPQALNWLASTLSQTIHASFLLNPTGTSDSNATTCSHHSNTTTRHNSHTKKDPARNIAYVLIHGAGSFGHFQAKQFGLRGVSLPEESPNRLGEHITTEDPRKEQERRFRMHGVAQTRRSVQQLNHHVVSALLGVGVNAISLSPAFGPLGGTPTTVATTIQEPWVLQDLIRSTLSAGLMPVLHGDAFLFQDEMGVVDAGILSGDTLVQMMASEGLHQRVVFLTDVAGVFTADPNRFPNATSIPHIQVTLKQPLSHVINNTGASSRVQLTFMGHGERFDNLNTNIQNFCHDHDVTGGLVTKLQSAISIVRDTGLNVTIAKFGSPSARILFQEESGNMLGDGPGIQEGTVLFRQQDAK